MLNLRDFLKVFIGLNRGGFNSIEFLAITSMLDYCYGVNRDFNFIIKLRHD